MPSLAQMGQPTNLLDPSLRMQIAFSSSFAAELTRNSRYCGLVLNYFWSKLLRELGLIRRITPVFAVIANSACDVERIQWDKLTRLLYWSQTLPEGLTPNYTHEKNFMGSQLASLVMDLRIQKQIALVAMLFALFVEPTFAVPSTSAAPPACAHCAAPGPIAGAGLPILAIGGGAYWLVRLLRRRRTEAR